MAQIPYLSDINLSGNQLLNAKMQNLGLHPFTASDVSKKGMFYYNTADSAAYIWDGDKWDLMSEADMPAHTFRGNNTEISGTPINLTSTQVTAELDLFSATLKGLVPLSGGGTTNFLRADGTWSPLAPQVYPGAGIAISTGTGWGTSIVDNSTNWNTAFTDRNKWDGGATGLVAATGRTSLGATTVGSNIFTSVNPTAITFLRANADNTVSWLDAATFRTAIGAGTSSTVGTVTSVAALTIGATGTAPNSTVATGTTTPVITLNIPMASAVSVTAGLLSKADWDIFNSKQAGSASLTSLSGLSFVSNSFVKMTAAGTFALDTNTYLTSVTAHNLLSAVHGDTLADTVVRGDLMVGNLTPKWSRLAFPAAPTGKILQATATDVAWSANPITIGASASISGSNTGDQTSIVGISGTKAQFNTAVSDGDIVFLDSIDTITGVKTFLDTRFVLRNVANTFNGSFTNTNTANRVYTLQDGNGTLAFLSDVAAAVVGGMVNKGAYDAAANSPMLDSTPIAGIKNGWTYTVSVAGTFFDKEVQVGDVIIANVDNPTLVTQWTILNKNIPDIVNSAEGIVGIVAGATQVEVTAAAVDNKYVSPLKLRSELTGANWVYTAPSFGNGVLTSFAFTHGLIGGSLSPTVLITDTTTKMVVQTQIVITSSTVVTIDFNVAPTANQYTVVIKK